jgi:hypothetical protein
MVVGLIGVVTFASMARRRRVVIPGQTTVVEGDETRGYRG